MAFAGRTLAMMAVIAAASAMADPDPKPIVAEHFGVPVTQFPAEAFRYDPRAGHYQRYTNAPLQYNPILEQGPRGGSGGRNYFIANGQLGGYEGYAVEDPRVAALGSRQRPTAGVDQGLGFSGPSAPVRPLHQQQDKRVYSPGIAVANLAPASPQFGSSYNGVVRRAGIGEDGRDFRGEPGIYAIRGGVFPPAVVDYERPDAERYFYRQPLPYILGPSGDFGYHANYRPPYLYSAAARPRPVGYSPEIHARGEGRGSPQRQRPPGDGAHNYSREGEHANYDDYGGVGRFAGVLDGHRERHGQQLQREQLLEQLHSGYPVRQESEEDGYRGDQRVTKIPVRGVNGQRAPQVFYAAERNTQGNGGRQYNR